MVFSYARYKKYMQEKTVFGMKDCLVLPGLGWKFLMGLKEENDEPIYNYIDKYIRWFLQQSKKKKEKFVLLTNTFILNHVIIS